MMCKALWLWVRKGRRAIAAHRERVRRGEIFPPFLFLALTGACNLRCRGCWIEGSAAPRSLTEDEVERIIASAGRRQVFFHTLLGGEPFLYGPLWRIVERHPECYFQIITNGMYLDERAAARIRRLGNVTPLVSLDGLEASNDARRGEGVFAAATEGLVRLKQQKVLFGVATTVTAANYDEVLSDEYVRRVIEGGAMYLWYYVYRPMGTAPSEGLCVSEDRMIELRRRLLALRRRHPIVLIDTYWDAEGRAVCPAAAGLGFHIGAGGSVEPCPPLSVACETVREGGGDLVAVVEGSRFLRAFQQFVGPAPCGCAILERPGELADFLRRQEATDFSGRDLVAELAAAPSRTSHHLADQEIPEDYWLYRVLKRQLFFGMGGYG